MANYKLTRAAENDFESIFDFGIERFGLEQAERYQRGLIERFDRLAESPLLYAAVDYIRSGYRRSVYHAHAIYYRIEGEEILIVRILGPQDTGEAFPADEDE